MKIYDCFGTFDEISQSFNLAVQTTNIGFDEFYVSQYYDICSPNRYAIVAILQTRKDNEMDMTPCEKNCALLTSNEKFSKLDPYFVTPIDWKISDAKKGDIILVYTLHAIGFNLKNSKDEKILEDFKNDIQPVSEKGSPPSVGGKGVVC